jgi:hypothetical protein
MSASPEPVGSEVLQLRAKNPAWDGRRLRARLLALGHPLGTVLAAGTITDRLRCHCWLNRTATPRTIRSRVSRTTPPTASDR